MARRFLEDTSPFVQLLFLAFLSLLVFLVVSIAATLLAIPFFGIDVSRMNDLAGNLEDPLSLRFLKYMQFVQSLSLFLVPAFLFLMLTRGNVSRFLGLEISPKWFPFFLVVLIMIFLVPVNNVLAGWNGKMHLPAQLAKLEELMRTMEERASDLTVAFLRMDHFGAYLVNIILIALLPAVGEEMMFRGAIQPVMIRWTRNVHAGIWISAFLFSFFHFQFFGLLPRWLLGIVFGYLFYWSKTLWFPMLAHFINNGLAVTVYYIYGARVVEEKVDTIGTSETGIYAIVAVGVTGFLLFLFYREFYTGKPVERR